MDGCKVTFENFDRSLIGQTYTRVHYGKARLDGLTFSFCVFETWLKESGYHSFSLNFINASPGNSEDISRFLIQKTKERLSGKT